MQHLRPLTKGAALTVGVMSLLVGPLAGATFAGDRGSSKADARAEAKAGGSEDRKAPAITEDDDDDDVANNVVDDGDNRHPSGKDRSVEHGGSGNQGAAAHEPDDDGH